ncbi:MAG: HlyD family efflux transporter periplasmic adaptor subunit [Rhodobacterales bacterium]|nr:HlyD family efflux transporter periplasmic adaptor subunit [Rhodobacterales bacterium]NCT13118.1 HlyD family efflux transporter periplasmic adaptor subunit [Rhodobacterales bacterium]
MEVRHERPNPDTEFRLRAPLTLGLPDGDVYQITQWSLRAVYDRRLAGHDLSQIILSIPFQGVSISFPAALVPGDTSDEFLFVGLDGRQREILALFYGNLLTGRMASTDQIITSLDTPVDLVPMEETPAERAADPAVTAPRKARIIGHLGVYAAIFLLLLGYLASLAVARLNHIPVYAARIEAPLMPVTSPLAGQITQVLATPGSKVAAGDPLVNVDGLVVVAPADGQVASLAVTPSQFIGSATPLLMVERDEPRHVLAFLDPAHALNVWPGMRATVTHMEGGRQVRQAATVQSVTGDGDFETAEIRVILRLDGLDAAASRDLLTDGAPVDVRLKRDRVRRFFGFGPKAPERAAPEPAAAEPAPDDAAPPPQ